MGYYAENETTGRTPANFSREALDQRAAAASAVVPMRPETFSEAVSGAGEMTFEQLCEKYKAAGHQGSMYVVTTNISQDDDMDKTMEFLFKEPKAASYDRYVKTANVSSSKAMRTFVLDNICQEQRNELEKLLGEYPAMGISLGEKLLYMLGLSKTTTVRRL